MGDGTRFAIAIAIFFAAGFAFFIAFHPSGSTAANHPDDVLQWLLGEYQQTAGTGSPAPAAGVAPSGTTPNATTPGSNASPGSAIGSIASGASTAIGNLPLCHHSEDHARCKIRACLSLRR